MLENPFARDVQVRDGIPIAPGAFPGLGHSPTLFRDGIEFFCRQRDTLGPLFWIQFRAGDWNVVCASRDGFEILKSKVASMGPIKQGATTLLGESLLGQDGAVHQRMRSAMNGPFTPRGLTATGIGAVVAELITDRVAGWAERRDVTVLAEMQAITLHVIFRLIGVEVRDLAAWGERYRDFVFSAFPIFPEWLPGSPMKRAAESRAWLDEHLLAIVREHRARPRNGTFISELVHGQDEQGRGLTEREMIDNLRLLTLAGHETTASVLAWLTITLARRPDLWEALCEEARAATDLPTTPQEIRAFPFAEALFREALRMYPAVSYTARKLVEPLALCGFTIPAGTHAGVAICALSRDPELYPSPDRFDPARWLGRKDPPSPIETVQFGGGPHFCLGYHLALMESVQFALALARRMSAAGLCPRLADGPAPRHYHLPLGHPTRSTRIQFV